MDPGRNHVFQDKRDRLMTRLALDDRRRRFLSFVSAVLPLPDEPRDLYGDPRSRMLPGLYFRSVKWRMKGWRGLVQPADLTESGG